MIDNSGKTAAIFGIRNDSSIAWPIAKKLSESGCDLAVSYTTETKNDVLNLLKEHGLNVILADNVDVRNENDIIKFIADISAQKGKIDYILHAVAYGNANVMCSDPADREAVRKYLDISFDDLMDSFNISAYSLLRICRVAEKYLAPNASILTLTYNASQRVFPGYAGMSINKAALENMMIYLAHYFGQHGVRVNAISAGVVMSLSAAGIKGVRRLRKITKASSPLGNISAEDVANTALYYFSPLSNKVTGNIHYLDGGFNIMGVSSYE